MDTVKKVLPGTPTRGAELNKSHGALFKDVGNSSSVRGNLQFPGFPAGTNAFYMYGVYEAFATAQQVWICPVFI